MALDIEHFEKVKLLTFLKAKNDDGAPGAATALGDARFVETQTMKSDDLFVVGHRVSSCC